MSEEFSDIPVPKRQCTNGENDVSTGLSPSQIRLEILQNALQQNSEPPPSSQKHLNKVREMQHQRPEMSSPSQKRPAATKGALAFPEPPCPSQIRLKAFQDALGLSSFLVPKLPNTTGASTLHRQDKEDDDSFLNSSPLAEDQREFRISASPPEYMRFSDAEHDHDENSLILTTLRSSNHQHLLDDIPTQSPAVVGKENENEHDVTQYDLVGDYLFSTSINCS